MVYDDGLRGGWAASASFGTEHNLTDPASSRPGSNFALVAAARPFAALVLSSRTPFNSSSVLDAWLCGSALTNAALHLEDSRGGRTSTTLPLTLASGSPPAANVYDGVARVMGPLDDGWSRLQVSLAALAEGAATPRTPLTADAWDRIVINDVSGKGFNLSLDSAVLRAASPAGAGAPANTSCLGAVCNPSLAAAAVEQTMVPLYGGELAASDLDGPSAVIAKLAPGSTAADVATLCAELAGALDTPERQARFRGACKRTPEPLPQLVEPLGSKDQGEPPLDWPFLAIAAQSEARGCANAQPLVAPACLLKT